uniref:Putative UBA-like protein n=1 Tax=Helianthus annuus TaxID=4232 RepID=A0A251RZ39_HELAN
MLNILHLLMWVMFFSLWLPSYCSLFTGTRWCWGCLWELFEAKIKLVELGFSRDAVIQALKLFDGNEEQAAGYLLPLEKCVNLLFLF